MFNDLEREALQGTNVPVEGSGLYTLTIKGAPFVDQYGVGYEFMKHHFSDKRRTKLRKTQFFRAYVASLSRFAGWTRAAGMWFQTSIPDMVDFPALAYCGENESGTGDPHRDESSSGPDVENGKGGFEYHTVDLMTGEFDADKNRGESIYGHVQVAVPEPDYSSSGYFTSSDPAGTTRPESQDGTGPEIDSGYVPLLTEIEVESKSESEATSIRVNNGDQVNETAHLYWQYMDHNNEASYKMAAWIARTNPNLDMAKYDHKGWPISPDQNPVVNDVQAALDAFSKANADDHAADSPFASEAPSWANLGNSSTPSTGNFSGGISFGGFLGAFSPSGGFSWGGGGSDGGSSSSSSSASSSDGGGTSGGDGGGE